MVLNGAEEGNLRVREVKQHPEDSTAGKQLFRVEMEDSHSTIRLLASLTHCTAA